MGCETIKVMCDKQHLSNIPTGIYMLKVNKRNTRTRCEKCSKLTIKTPEQCLNFEQVIDSWDKKLSP